MIKKLTDGSWCYRFYANGKDYRKRGFKTKHEAQESENKKRIEIKGFVVETNNLSILVENYLNKRKMRVKIATLKKDETTLKKYVLPQFKTTNAINNYSVEKWKSDIVALGFKEHYTNQVIKCFRMFLNYAKNYTFIDNRVIEELDIVKLYEIKDEMQIWSVDEFNQFISVIDDEYYKLMFETLFWSGLRISELRALTPKDIKDNSLYINKRLDSRYTKDFTTLKTANSQRKVLMPKWIIDELVKLETPVLFPTSETQIRRVLDKYIEKAKVKKIRLHDFRHSHASYLINNGCSIRLCSERLGHSSPSITMDYYWHLLPNEQEKVIDIIEKEKKA